MLDEFLPEERLVNRVEAVLRVFNQYGNRQNKNKARLKFVLRERGIVWLREAIDKEYADILANGGIEPAAFVPEGFGGFESNPQPLGNGSLLPVVNKASSGDPEYDRWLDDQCRRTAAARLRDRHRAARAGQRDCGPDARPRQHRAHCGRRHAARHHRSEPSDSVRAARPICRACMRLSASSNLAGAGAHELEDVTTCPGAYSCNLALTKSMNLGAALSQTVRQYDDPELRKLSIKISGCPNSCGQHWIADFGFYGNARKIDGKEVPYYQMLLGGGEDETGVMRFGLAIQSIPARLAPQAVQRVLEHYIADRQEGETFRQYVLRHKVEFFRQKIADLAKPPELFPEIYQDWGDDEAFSLKLGRGECAA